MEQGYKGWGLFKARLQKGQILQSIEKKTTIKHAVTNTFLRIKQMGHTALIGRMRPTQIEAATLKSLAKARVTAKAEVADLKRELVTTRKEISLKSEI